jgi:hypothetical protein
MKKKSSLTRELIANVLGYIFLLGSAFFIFAIKLKSPSSGISTLASKFWLPLAIFWFSLAILAFIGTLYDSKGWHRSNMYNLVFYTLGYWLYALILYMVVLMISIGYGFTINAFTGSGEIINFEGEIIEKKISMYKGGKTYYIIIIDNKTKSIEEFNVRHDTFNNLLVGNTYKEQYYKGGLGIPYRWWE